MTDDRPKKETEEKSDSEKVDDALTKALLSWQRFTYGSDLPIRVYNNSEQDADSLSFIDFILNEIDEGVEARIRVGHSISQLMIRTLQALLAITINLGWM